MLKRKPRSARALLTLVLASSRTGSGPVSLATIRAVIAAVKDTGYLHVLEGRRDHATPAETLRLPDLD